MGLKTKLAVGIMSGALGLTLVGGGTWAAFNDVETVSNTFAAGTLDLGKGTATEVFKVENMKPGDHFTKSLKLTNDGSLDINKIYLNASGVKDWSNKDILNLPNGAGTNTQDEFLDQFEVKITNKTTGAVAYGENGSKTLKNLVADAATNNGSGVEITKSADGAAGLKGTGSAVDFEVYVKFKEDNTLIEGTRLHAQNKYQGEGAKIDFVFEATQMPGQQK